MNPALPRGKENNDCDNIGNIDKSGKSKMRLTRKGRAG